MTSLKFLYLNPIWMDIEKPSKSKVVVKFAKDLRGSENLISKA